MTSGPHLTAHTATDGLHPATRLRLKPKAPATGYVDGAWWPESRDLVRELPALLTVLGVRLHGVERFTYHLETWPGTPRKVRVGDEVVRAEGFRTQPADTVTAIGSSGERVTLLVVPPDTEAEFAHDVLMTAAHRGNNDSIASLLAAPGGEPAEIDGDLPRPRPGGHTEPGN
ncbi:DUF5994 family protein [Amycolatopsis magusensis]|uniref:Uncharacterized protein n=1 Tax=Amycolatopsis magusensis TaxID=882444 RepID=A0ABS4Q1X2_9PSEU|nr:DUF5994 family protein [Amycolatopsis magusensis]MBP2185688.1 hypothetical protein [Amycolatopsis magusensis]MDI5980547.1 DUF5994 family protein [Amycolatopsis magusensis]